MTRLKGTPRRWRKREICEVIEGNQDQWYTASIKEDLDICLRAGEIAVSYLDGFPYHSIPDCMNTVSSIRLAHCYLVAVKAGHPTTQFAFEACKRVIVLLFDVALLYLSERHVDAVDGFTAADFVSVQRLFKFIRDPADFD